MSLTSDPLRGWMRWSALALLSFGSLEPACGTDGSGTGSNADAGEQDSATNPPPGDDGGQPDSTTPPGTDAGQPDSTTPPGTDAGQDATTPPPDSGPPDSSPGTEAGGDGSPGDAGEGGSPACTGNETACTAGALAGLCVAGQCLPCNSPDDNANCTAAYGDGGSATYVCTAAGSCVPGNCIADTDCTGANSGEICGLTTPNQCGPCTNDTQCQSDPSYGAATICSPSTGACVTATCSANATACSANAADFCCGDICVPGDCCTNADCATSSHGNVCGGGGPNTCGKCTSDSQCDPGSVCKTTSGQCVTNTGLCSGAPSATGGQPGACPNVGGDISDICCGDGSCFAPPATSGTVPCCPGAAGTTYCETAFQPGATCVGNVCTTCAAVSGASPVYYVDPVNGRDSGTGNLALADGGTSGACALKTITRAFQLIGKSAAVSTTVVIIGGSGVSLAATEAFPLAIPANVTVTTQKGPVVVQIPAGKVGFTMNAPNSSLTSADPAPLEFSTKNTSTTGATSAIVVGTGSAATTQISNVTIEGMLNNGILVNGSGVVTIGPGVVAVGNGSVNTRGNGLFVQGTAEAIIDVPAGAQPTSFSGNSAHGILVEGTAFVLVTGAVTSVPDGTGSVVVHGNASAGVWIQQTPGATAPPQNVFDGLVASSNTTGNGMRIVAGSNVKVRNSVFLANGGNGVVVSTGGTATSPSNDIHLIDLGTSGPGGSNGGNVFQAPLGSSNNGRAGICLNVAAGSGTLNAAGNAFQAADCSSSTATLSLNGKSCLNNATLCPGGVCDLALTAATGNGFDVSTCTP